jgi:dihydroneopterin aldolase
VTETRLFLTGITAAGRLGANPGERDAPQDVVIDLDVEVRPGGDALAETSDYRGLIRTARDVVSDGEFELLESLAAAVARTVAASPGVIRATALVHKPAAARSNEVQGIAAAFTAEA